MRRIAAIAALLATAVLAVFGQAASGDADEYEVRAIFDNGGFLVPGEEVRVAGATVGCGVVRRGDAAGRAGARGRLSGPGKAVVVMKIDDAGFQDFRQDASCLIRPQSLLGEKFVDCQPTLPRASGSEPPDELEEIPDGEPGAGQHFLPVENNGKAVDIDLINNIMEEPYADRFRLILNDLGAGFAARGDDLAEIIQRADPALRQTNLVLAELARQNQALSRLARDGDTVLAPWARERRATAGFINNAQVAAEATAERSADLEAGFQRFPEALRQLRLTMAQLKAFSDQATPVFAEFRDGGPAIARATRALGPFADATEPSLTSLGTAAEQSRQPLLDSVPTLRDAVDLTESAAPGARRLAELFEQPPADRLPRAVHEPALQHDRRHQQLRPVRPLPPRLADSQQRLHAAQRFPQRCLPSALRRRPSGGQGERGIQGRGQAGPDIGAPCGVGPGGVPGGLRQPPRPSSGAGLVRPVALARRRAVPARHHDRQAAAGDRRQPVTRRRAGVIASSPVLVGAITTLIVILAVFLAYNANNGLPFVPTYRLSVLVPNANTLVKGNDARIGGVRVGIVEKIEPVQDDETGEVYAKVDLKLDKSAEPVPEDSTVVVRSRSALGLKYLEINKGTSDEGYEEGSTLPLRVATPEPVEIDEFFNIFDEPTRLASQANLVAFGDALAGRGPDLNVALGELRPLVTRLEPVARNLASPKTGDRAFLPGAGRQRLGGGAGRRDPSADVRRPRVHLRRLRQGGASLHPGVDLGGAAHLRHADPDGAADQEVPGAQRHPVRRASPRHQGTERQLAHGGGGVRDRRRRAARRTGDEPPGRAHGADAG